jgi:NAD dependent epimerase/dehydratase family enzyme
MIFMVIFYLFYNAPPLNNPSYLSSLARETEMEASQLIITPQSIDHVPVQTVTTHHQPRLIFMRFGSVLDRNGGLLKQIIPMFKLGLGGSWGPGNQIFPWISLVDTIRAIEFLALDSHQIDGPVNFVAPSAPETSNMRFTQALSKALHRPSLFPVPGKVLQSIMGMEPAQEFLLKSLPVLPAKLMKEKSWKFHDNTIEEFLLKNVGGYKEKKHANNLSTSSSPLSASS